MEDKVLADYYRFSNRRTGKTMAQIELCKRHNGVLICPTENAASEIRDKHKIKAISIQAVKRGATEGIINPSIYDPDALIEHIVELGVELQEMTKKANSNKKSK